MGLLTRADSVLYRNFFNEMCILRGIHVFYQYPVKIDPTIHAEMITELSKPQPLDIIFETNPKINTLKRIGWASSNPDDKPYIAYVPFDTPELQVESVITIPPFIEISTNCKKFKVTSINTIIEFPDCWTCTLAPIFETNIPKNNYDASNYNYIDTDDTPDSDTPDNKANKIDDIIGNDSGEYFKL